MPRKVAGLLALAAALYLNLMVTMPADVLAAATDLPTASEGAVQSHQLLAAHRRKNIDNVQVTISSEKPIPNAVKKRMEKSISAIAQQLLEGQRIDSAAAKRLEYQSIITSVFDRVLVGYDLEGVSLDIGNTANMEVRLRPWTDCVSYVQVNTKVEGMRPPVEKLVLQDVRDIGKVFEEVLIGLPVGAADWSNGVIKSSVDEYLRQHAPEFRADFAVSVDKTASVQLVLYPVLPVVRTVDLSMRSDTVPNLTLLTQRDFLQEEVNQLVMTPVAFVARHQAELDGYFAEQMNARPDLKTLGINTVVTITPGEQLQVMSRSDARHFRFRIEGWADIWHDTSEKNRDLMFRVHVGHMLTSRDELFMLLDVYPQDFTWGWDLGYAHKVLPWTWLHARYDIQDHYAKLGIMQQLARKWFLRYEYRNLDNVNEFGLRYSMHDFLSIEYVVDRQNSWLRLIGNF